MDEITLKALAKINLGLDVVRRREDGYHEVRGMDTRSGFKKRSKRSGCVFIKTSIT